VRHHHAKHEAGWQPRRLPNGDLEWTSPTGHVYIKEAATYPIDQTLHPPEPTAAKLDKIAERTELAEQSELIERTELAHRGEQIATDLDPPPF
jgi:hypothetical protein